MKFLRPIFIVCVVLFFLPRTVHAEEAGQVVFFQEDAEGEFVPVTVEVMFGDGFLTEEKAFVLFDVLCGNRDELKSFVPEGTTLLSVYRHKNKIMLNFSKEAENGGGSMNARLFVKQIVDTAYSIDEIRGIMVYVEGELSSLAEGIEFSVYDRE